MIRLLDGMPAGVIGLEAVDDVEKEDYEDVPGQVRAFPLTELEQAKLWAAGTST
jgi:hypothetical protein